MIALFSTWATKGIMIQSPSSSPAFSTLVPLKTLPVMTASPSLLESPAPLPLLPLLLPPFAFPFPLLLPELPSELPLELPLPAFPLLPSTSTLLKAVAVTTVPPIFVVMTSVSVGVGKMSVVSECSTCARKMPNRENFLTAVFVGTSNASAVCSTRGE